ncbi:hypothetical protein ROSI111154_13360 [Rouxiella silvae]
MHPDMMWRGVFKPHKKLKCTLTKIKVFYLSVFSLFSHIFLRG